MAIKTATRMNMPAAKRNQKVMWAFPMDELMYSRWAMWLLMMPRRADDMVVHIIGTYVPFARNSLHQEFLKSGYEWLFMLDSDVCPPFEIVDVLLSHKLKCVSGWYSTKELPKKPCVYKETGLTDERGIPTWEIYKQPGTGLEKVDGIGFGCMLMHRDVAGKLGDKPYDENQGGEDLSVSRQIRALGFDVWVDWSMGAKHVGLAVY